MKSKQFVTRIVTRAPTYVRMCKYVKECESVIHSKAKTLVLKAYICRSLLLGAAARSFLTVYSVHLIKATNVSSYIFYVHTYIQVCLSKRKKKNISTTVLTNFCEHTGTRVKWFCFIHRRRAVPCQPLVWSCKSLGLLFTVVGVDSSRYFVTL